MPIALYNVRILCVLAGFLLGFGVLEGWFYQLQVGRHEELFAKARALYTETQTCRGSRGAIVDVNGNLLAGTENCMDVLAEPRKIPPARRQELVMRLARFLAVPAPTLFERFGSGRVEVVVRREVPLKRARALANQGLPGLRFTDSETRLYPKHSLAAVVLGFNQGDRGSYGLEKFCDAYLRPGTGSLSFLRDRKGQPLHATERVEVRPTDGKTVFLTLDEPIQHLVEAELDNLMADSQARGAYAIMANPRTGAIMAIAQRPTFDLNEREQMTPAAWVNHLATDVYDPGSTMKAIAICGALEYNVITLHSRFFCENGLWWYGGKPLRDSGHHYENLYVYEGVQKSSNILTAKVALLLGEARLYQTFRRFGFGQPTGLEIADESRGILKPVKNWDNLSITRYPIGQGISVTAPQMLQAYCALANRGRMMQLHLLAKAVDPQTGNPVFAYEPKLKQVAASPRAVGEMVKALKLVTQPGGTAEKAAIPGFEVAGKTGTSQKCIGGSYEGHDKYVASFVGFVPADDPAFVLLVLADEPQRVYYGGTVTAPVFRRIAEPTLRYLNIQPTVPVTGRTADDEHAELR